MTGRQILSRDRRSDGNGNVIRDPGDVATVITGVSREREFPFSFGATILCAPRRSARTVLRRRNLPASGTEWRTADAHRFVPRTNSRPVGTANYIGRLKRAKRERFNYYDWLNDGDASATIRGAVIIVFNNRVNKQKKKDMSGGKGVTLNRDACHVERRPFCFPVRGCASAQREKKKNKKEKITKKRVIIINKRTSQFLRTLAILRHDHEKKKKKW